MSKINIRLCLASAALLAGPMSMLPLLATEVPDAVAAHGEVLVTSVNATGVQVYECKADAGGKLVWEFREPVATLLANGMTVGRHYAGPRWEMADGSTVGAKVSTRAPGATENDIPLLKLEVTSWRGTGQLAGVTTIQRINTNGGVASGPCDAAGDILSVPYSADYTFLRKDVATVRAPTPVVSRTAPSPDLAYAVNPIVLPRPAIGVIIVRGDDRDRRPRKKNGEPKSPTGEPKSPPGKPTPPTAEPKSPPIVPNKTVRDHRGTNGSGGGTKVTPTRPSYDGAEKAEGNGPSETRKPKVRDHRGVEAASRDGSSANRQPKIRDHRGSATASNDKPGGATSGGKPPSKPGSGSKPICGISGTPPCLPQ